MILSIDLGTSKLCAATIDPESARPLAIRSCPNDSGVTGLPDDFHEQDPVRTRDLCFDLIRQVLSDPSAAGRRVDTLGISGQMHGVLLVDQGLHPLTNLITWRDRRTARDGAGSIVESLDRLGQDVEERTGCRLAVGYGAATLRWLDANGLIPAGSTALTIAGFIAASLTGVPAIDETHAASWGIFDLTQYAWDSDCVTRLGIPPEVLPEVKPSSMPLGETTEEARSTLGLDHGAVVCSPVGDAQASVIGAAGFSPDAIVLNLGTGGQISVPRAHYTYSEEMDAWPMPFGTFLLLGATLCGGWAYAYLRQFFQSVARDICGVELTDEEVYERMNALAASASPGANGLVADTRFSGTRKDKSITGSITGIDTTNLTPANLSLAVIEGIVRDLCSMWLSTGAKSVSRLVASGNAVRRNPVLRSVIRRVFGIDCFMSSAPEEAARGAGYAAAVGSGMVSEEEITARVGEFAEPL